MIFETVLFYCPYVQLGSVFKSTLKDHSFSRIRDIFWQKVPFKNLHNFLPNNNDTSTYSCILVFRESGMIINPMHSLKDDIVCLL